MQIEHELATTNHDGFAVAVHTRFTQGSYEDGTFVVKVREHAGSGYGRYFRDAAHPGPDRRIGEASFPELQRFAQSWLDANAAAVVAAER